jgi:hypothetical protein
VIELGKKIAEPDPSYGIEVWGTIALVIIIIGLILAFQESYIGALQWFGLCLVMTALILCLAGQHIGSNRSEKIYEQNVEQWKQKAVNTYISSLPKEKKEIVFIKIESELTSMVAGNIWYTDSSEEKKTPLTVSFKEDKITTLTNWFDASMEITDKSDAYVEYQRVPINLGHGLEAGYYNLSVHLPNTYKFVEIK